MIKNLSITVTEDSYKKIVFSGGEIHIEFDSNLLYLIEHNKNSTTQIQFNIPLTNSEKVMELVLLNNHFQELGFKTSAIIGYMPYARQDRQTTEGTLHSLKHFARLINSCNFESVTVVDPHSLAVVNCIKKCRVISLNDIFKNGHNNVSQLQWTRNHLLIAPDLGALKKVESMAKQHNLPFVAAHKVRNPATGEIESIKLLGNVPEGKDIVVVDDICDGGFTFIELLNKTNIKQISKSVSLYVTHGIFAKGIDILVEAGYNTVYTTNTIPQLAHKNKVVIPYNDSDKIWNIGTGLADLPLKSPKNLCYNTRRVG